MTITDLSMLFSIIIGIISAFVAVLMYIDKRRNTNNAELLSDPDFVIKNNDAIRGALERAISAERRADEMEKRLSTLESVLSYRITFDVVLGSDPKVEHVTITHFPDRRIENKSVMQERRK